jgi:two-component system sensor histidine kinase CreC
VVRIRTRIFFGVLFVVSIAFVFLLYWITDDLEPQYRKATEEPLVDSARILAAVAGDLSREGVLEVDSFARAYREMASRNFSARIYDFEKQSMDYRVYITNADGKVLFNSWDEDEVGMDYSQWNDVYLTLRGEYGARTTRDSEYDDTTSVMYVAAPVIVDGRTIGVLTVGKPTNTSAGFVLEARRKIIAGGAIVLLSVVLVVALVSGMTTSPIYRLIDYARGVRDGKRDDLPELKGSEAKELGRAFEEMRDALEGKNYIENYVQTLTHEVKSPLAGIQGAAELLTEEEMAEEQRAKFLRNIIGESQRIEMVIEKLLLLSSLETRRGIREVSEFRIGDVLQDIRQAYAPQLEKKGILLGMRGDLGTLISGDRFLVRHAISNLLHNAVEFSPQGAEIELNVTAEEEDLTLELSDNGPGIPDYAAERIFERFFSIKRPDTGRKSSGLGLSLVKEVALLHGGDVTVENDESGGVLAVFSIPLSQPV